MCTSCKNQTFNCHFHGHVSTLRSPLCGKVGWKAINSAENPFLRPERAFSSSAPAFDLLEKGVKNGSVKNGHVLPLLGFEPPREMILAGAAEHLGMGTRQEFMLMTAHQSVHVPAFYDALVSTFPHAVRLGQDQSEFSQNFSDRLPGR